MSIDCRQFRSLTTRTLKNIGLYSPAAVNLLLGTAAQESAFGTYICQIGGPANGVFQMEALTFNDLKHRLGHQFPGIQSFTFDQLEYDLRAAIIMARLKYLSIPKPLPSDPEDVAALGEYWKAWYNTPLGAGTVQQFVKNYRRYVTA